jgi:hypothetical protein
MSSGAGIGAPNGAPCLPHDAGAVAPDLMTGRPVEDRGLPGNVGSDPPTVLTLSRDVDEDDDNTVEHALDGRRPRRNRFPWSGPRRLRPPAQGHQRWVAAHQGDRVACGASARAVDVAPRVARAGSRC